MKQLTTKNKKILAIILLSLAALFAIIYSISTLIYRAGKTKVSIYYAPGNATVTLNDTKISNRSDEWIIPGKYHLKVSFNEHFETYEEDIEINEENHEFYGTLAALDDEGSEYITKHREDFYIAEGKIGELLAKKGKKQKDAYPILNYLPINNSLYSISYQYDENQKPIINVKADPKYLDVAISAMKLFENVDLASEHIVFHLNNPFTNTNTSTSSDYKTFLTQTYNLPSNYKIGELKQIDDYYYTTIYISDYQNNMDYCHYLVALKKSDEGWKIISTPQPLLTVYNTPELSKETLQTINSY